jgi:hypothetical protein
MLCAIPTNKYLRAELASWMLDYVMLQLDGM